MKYIILIFLIIVLILIVVVIYPVYIEPYWIQIKKIKIDDNDIPDSFKEFKIIFLTDIHHGPYFSINRVKKVVKKVNKLKPDIVLLGGDYVHRDEKYIKPCFNECAKIKAKFGIFGVLGNHDHWENAVLTKESMKSAQISLLDNIGYWIQINNEKIKIGGVGDFWEDKQDISATIDDVFENDFVILVSHNPDYAESIKTKKVDIMLSGHTHGGQVTLFGLYAPVLPSRYAQKYRTGIVENPNIMVIISNGIGTISPPVRFFCRPQIVELILE